MNKPVAIDVPATTSGTTIAAPLDAETAKLVADLAAKRGQSSEQFAAEAIQRVAESEADFDAFIQEGIDALDRGEVVSHEEVMAELDEMIEAHRARCG